MLRIKIREVREPHSLGWTSGPFISNELLNGGVNSNEKNIEAFY